MNVAQYISKYLAAKSVDKVFMLTGGGAMFLNDALSFEPGITPVYCHHEQACSMAAEGYARIKGHAGVVNVTTGPGGINALNGVYGAFTDSIPMIVISGQVKRATHLRHTPVPGLRQLGDQEVDIVSMASPVCKFAESIFDPLKAPELIAKAWAEAHSGRPGPVWLDIPIDVQSSPLPDDLCERGLLGAFEAMGSVSAECLKGEQVAEAARHIVDAIGKSARPLMLWGTGVRLANVHGELLKAAEALGCPVSTGWTHDTIASDHPLFAGRPGTIGTRAGNFALQNCDLLVVLGSRLNIRQTSYNIQSFAKNARVIQVDVDPAELAKPGARIDEAFCVDLVCFADEFKREASKLKNEGNSESWQAWIKDRKVAFPNIPPHAFGSGTREGFINPYAFIDALVESLPSNAVIATGNASACILPFQCAKIREGMRLFSNSGSASMGFDIPAAIGAACADMSRPVVCLAGDGSAQLNIQELETIARLKLDIKIVILDNGGYLSIKSSQNNFFGRLAGCNPDSGVGFPDYVKLAEAYGLKAIKIGSENWRERLTEHAKLPGPLLIQAMLDPNQGFEPRMSSRKLPDGRIVSPEIEDMHPFMERDELARAMDVGYLYGGNHGLAK